MAGNKKKEKKSFSGFFKNLRRPSEAVSGFSSHQAGSNELTSPPTVRPAPTLLSLDSKSIMSPSVTSTPSTIFPRSDSSQNAESSPTPRKSIGLIELTHQDECSGPASGRGWADIVAVHGIGGDAYRTWTASNGALWLRDFLPKDIENVRVFSFGYDARVWPTKAKGTIESFARSLLNDLRMIWLERGKEKRPLIFVCHSMGGIVLKKAFIIARLSPDGEYPFMKQYVKGIIFMGTPHQGSDAVKWPQLLANLVDFGLYFGSSFTGKTRKDLLQELAKDSKNLELMATEFVNQIGKMQIVSCVEQRATPPLSSQVVCRQSALLNLPSERIIMMDDCDHRTMCQFRNAQDRNYRLIRSEVEELLGLTANHMRVEAISDCLRYLQFAEMSNRHHDIDPAAINTCAWLLEHPKFEDWRDQKQRLLWIRGKPGAGKSTLMKYALETSIEESTAPNARMIILSFFFHGRGNNLQKSSEGFYRSMLHQILSRAPFSVDSMLRDFDQHVSNRGRPGQAWNWHIREYQKHLITALEILSEKFKFSVRIFVDALDEGGEITAQNMVDEFQHILEKSAQGTKLAICFSCRHYPIIDVEDHATIVIEDENDKDIRTFVTNSFGQDHGMETVRDIIIKKATGSFQWTRLVVELVRTKRRQGSLPQQIRQAIEAIPPDLNKLYRELLETIPQDELPTVVRVFEWMLFARNNLSVNELRIATAIDPNLPHKTLNEYLEKGLLMDNNDDFGRRLTTMSRGLAEIRADVDSRGRRTNQRVQFNHQSVIDFLHQDGLQILLGNQWQNREIAFGRANHTLSRICLHYVSMEHSFSAPPHTPSDSTEYDWATETYQLFATYAVRNWIYHMQKAHSFGISQVDLLECFAWPSNHLMDRWIDLCHLLDENAYYFAPRKSTLLHILSENGLVDALSLALNKRDRCFLQKVVDCKNEYGETPLFWAANADEVDAVKLLLEQGFADPNSQNIEGRTILSCAAVRGADEVVGLLLGCDGMDPESKDCEGRTPLVRASERGRHNVVRMLLERGAKSEIIDNEGRTPLLLASENGHEEVVKLLLAIDGARPNFVDDIGRTPLSWAARNGRDAVVEALLGCGEVQLDIKDKNGRSPLSLAVEFRRDKVINLLLARKIDFDMKDHGGRTPLSWAASSPGDLAGNRAVEALLLAGADVDSRDDSGRTPLSWAAAAPNRHGHNHAVKLLLEHGAEADSKDNSGRTPLSWAAEALPTLSKFTFWYTNWAVDILLSRSDVDARSRDSLGHDPLWWARERSSKRSVARLSGWYLDRLNVNHDEI